MTLTGEQEATLRDMCAKNLSDAAIALHFGWSERAVLRHRRRLDIVKTHIRLDHDAIAVEVMKGYPDSHVAKIFKCSANVVAGVRSRIGYVASPDLPPPGEPPVCELHGSRVWSFSKKGWRSLCIACQQERSTMPARPKVYEGRIVKREDPEKMWEALLRGRKFPNRVARRQPIRI